MLISLKLTDNCNLKCSYCYEGEHNNGTNMKLSTVNSIINFIERYCKLKNKDKQIIIGLYGGEPLLKFDLIKYFIDKMKKIKEEYCLDVNYIMTTNGTLLTNEVIDYIKENDIALSLSIDGLPKIQNKNRKTIDGGSTSNIIEDKLSYLIENMPEVIARMTYTPKTVSFLAEGISYLINAGFKNIKPVPDFFDNTWDNQDVEVLMEQLKITMKIVEQNKNIKLMISNLQNPLRKCSKCKGGISQFYIATNGDAYPCSYVIGEKNFLIDNVENIEEFKEERNMNKNYDFKLCKGCSYFQYCDASKCIYINYKMTGKEDEPTGFLCRYQQLIYSMRM